MVKDEDPFLREWIAYHLLLGFEHCIVVDDASARPVTELLGGWAPPQLVTVVRHETPQGQQATYARCLERFGRDFFWMAFLDVDEFFRIARPASCPDADWPRLADMRAILAEYEPYAALGVNWRMFSSGGHEKRPAGPVIANYTRCLGDDIHIKSLVRPAAVRACVTPHAFSLLDGKEGVDPEHVPLTDGFSFNIPHTARLAVNHYYYKSRECFRTKVARGNPVHSPRRLEEFDEHLQLPTTEDTGLIPFVEPVRAQLRQAALRPGGPKTGLVAAGDCQAALTQVAPGIRSRPTDAEELRAAHVRLADIAMANAASPAPDRQVDLHVWLLRALLARQSGDARLARLCLTQALRCGAGKEAYVLWAEFLLSQGDAAGSRAALSIAHLGGSIPR